MRSKNRYFLIEKRRRLFKIFGGIILLPILLCACNLAPSLPTTSAQPEITWRKTESLLFPATWPPTSKTVWVRYTFAYGTNPANLNDGTYVTQPLSKTEQSAGGIATTTVLSSEMKQAGVQGVLPIDNQTLKILENEKQVSAYCLKLSELPDLNLPEVKEMLAYYQAWFKYNGAFLNLIREQHAGFINWVTTNK